jgi:hypothetical protein
MPDKNTRWENDKEWAGWTIRDEIYDAIREYVRKNWIPTVVSFLIAIGSTVLAFVREHSNIGIAIASGTLGSFLLVVLALNDSRRRSRTLSSVDASPTTPTPPTIASPIGSVGHLQPQIVYDRLTEVLNGHDGNLYTHLWFHNASAAAAHKLIPHITWYSDGKTLFSFVGKWRDTRFDLGPKAIRGANTLDFLPHSEPRALDLCIRRPESADSYALSIESPRTNVFVDHRKIVPGRYEIKVLLSSDSYSIDFRFDVTKAANGMIELAPLLATNPHVAPTFAPKESAGAAEPSLSPARYGAPPVITEKEVYKPDYRDFPRVYRVDSDGTFSLVFLPDTDEKSQDGDALLVLTLGRKLMMGMDESPVTDSDQSMLRSGVRRRYSKGFRGDIEQSTALFEGNEPDLTAIAKGQIDGGFIRKVALSRGGAYTLTEQGKARALTLLQDMIERA